MSRTFVTPFVHARVMDRDLLAFFLHFNQKPAIICIAPIVDPSQVVQLIPSETPVFWACWGRSRIEHVKAEPRMGVRAESVEERLLALCQGHTEDGARAGHVWCTAHREDERAYLDAIYNPEGTGPDHGRTEALRRLSERMAPWRAQVRRA